MKNLFNDHVKITRNGAQAKFECLECGASESVANYENGECPKTFESRMGYNSEYSRCANCATEYHGNTGQKYN